MACRLRISVDDYDAAAGFQSFNGETSNGGGLSSAAFPGEDRHDQHMASRQNARRSYRLTATRSMRIWAIMSYDDVA
jgi:hypothetical protein